MKEFIKQVHHKEFVVVVDDDDFFFLLNIMKYFNLIFSLVVRKRHAEHILNYAHSCMLVLVASQLVLSDKISFMFSACFSQFQLLPFLHPFFLDILFYTCMLYT